MAREIALHDTIVGMGTELTAMRVDAGGVLWSTGIYERHEDIAQSAQFWRHKDGEEIATSVDVCIRVTTPEGYSLTIGPGGIARSFGAEELALALFSTDPDVVAFCERVGERHTVRRDGGDVTFTRRDAGYQRALSIAWERDESGRATKWRERAAAVLAAMGES